jgi:hypothetical protein
MLNKATNAALCIFLFSLLPATAGAGVPDWLRSLAQQPQRKYPADANAVTLLDDQETTVRDNGEIVTHQRLVYRILRPEGKDYATHSVDFDTETKVSSFHGWSITAKGQEYETKDKDALEHSLGDAQEFSDTKEKILVVPGAEVGTVVGFEYEQKRRPYVFQDYWFFQNMIPVEKSRYTLRVPRGWEYRADWLNHAEQKPAEQNGAYVWEVADVPRIELEYNEPDFRALAGHMIVTLFSEKTTHRNSESWNDLGVWYGQLTAGVRDPSPALQAKVQELAPPNLAIFERIRALSLFAQRDVRYYAIEIGIGGYRPHPAGEIFSHRYGDCKDKATVLSSMLAQIGVKSYYMPIHATRGIYNEKTPPNSAFNHVILAIQMPDASSSQKLPAMYEHPKLGHLLIFDPTNDLVPLGQLPPYEQNSYALLVTDSGGELIHLPVSSPDLNKVRREAKLKLSPDGTLQGEIEEIRSGYMAMNARKYWSISGARTLAASRLTASSWKMKTISTKTWCCGTSSPPATMPRPPARYCWCGRAWWGRWPAHSTRPSPAITPMRSMRHSCGLTEWKLRFQRAITSTSCPSPRRPYSHSLSTAAKRKRKAIFSNTAANTKCKPLRCR